MQRLLELQSYCFLVSLRFMADKCRTFEMGFQLMLLAVLFLSRLIPTLFAMARLCTRGSLVCPRFALDSDFESSFSGYQNLDFSSRYLPTLGQVTQTSQQKSWLGEL